MPTNNIMSNLMFPMVKGYEPKEGDGLTMCSWTDRTVGTIHKVHNAGHVEFSRDFTVADKSKGELYEGHQKWINTPTPSTDRNAHAMKRPDGRWYIAHLTTTGRWSVSKKSTPVAMGRKDYYCDWNF